MNVDRALSIAKQSENRALRDLADEVEAQIALETVQTRIDGFAKMLRKLEKQITELEQRFSKLNGLC